MANTVIVCLQVSSISGSVLKTVFEMWDSQGTLQCHSHHKSLRPVYIVQTTGGDTLSNNYRHIDNRVFFYPAADFFVVPCDTHDLLFLLHLYHNCRGGILWRPQWPPRGNSAP
ncbi:hypothetical protein GOODEAATRI_025586, partial [Goodea atripinnis]